MRSEIGTRWYFGWNIVAAAAVLTLLSTGMRLGVGPYFLPMAGATVCTADLIHRRGTWWLHVVVTSKWSTSC